MSNRAPWRLSAGEARQMEHPQMLPDFHCPESRCSLGAVDVLSDAQTSSAIVQMHTYALVRTFGRVQGYRRVVG